MKSFFKKHYKKCMLALLATACLLPLGACNPDDGGSVPPDNGAQEVVLNTEKLNMMLGDEVWLKASYEATAGQTLSWVSSNPAVATVGQDGKISAMGVGDATITATYADGSATCSVSVGTDGYLPMMRLEGINEENEVVSVSLVDELNVEPQVEFNGKTFTDGTWTYTLADPTLGEVQGGKFIPAKTGETELTIVGTWRGIQSDTLVKTVNLKVVNSTTVVVNGGLTSAVRLYTAAEHGGKSYDTSMPFVVSVQENGKDRPVEVFVETGEEVVEYNAATETVKALTYGEAEIAIYFRSTDGEDNLVKIPVVVERPLATYAETVKFFSAMDGDLDVDAIFAGAADKTIVHAYQNGTDQGDIELTVEDNKLLGAETLSTGVTNTQFIVYNQTVGYILDVEAYTKVVKTEQDLRLLNSNQSGSFVLNGDVECSGAWTNAGTFTGTFDGNGYAIKNYNSNERNGLFGKIGEGAVIKNLAITNASMTYYSASVLAAGSASSYYIPARIENVYVQVTKSTSSRPSALLWERGPWDTIQNVIVDVSQLNIATLATNKYQADETTPSGNCHGALFASDTWGMRDRSADAIAKNEGGNTWKRNESGIMGVYVIAPAGTPMARNVGYWNANYGDFTATMWASNEGIEADPNNRVFVYSGVKRFDSYLTMSSNINKVGTDDAYWAVNAQGVEWMGELPEVEAVEYEKTITFFSAADGDLPVAEIFGSADAVIIEAYQNGAPLSVVNNKVLGVATLRDQVTKTQITVVSSTAAYILNLEAYTKVIDEESDLAVFNVSTNNVDGYYVLKGDVECTGETLWTNHFGTAATNDLFYFNGILDGNGHAIRGLKVGNNGLFGVLGANAIIRNIAFTDVTLSGTDAWKYSCTLAHSSIASTGSGSAIENVYIHIKDFRTVNSGNRTAGLMFIYNKDIKINNVVMVIDSKNLTTDPEYGYGALFEHDRIKGTAPNMTNVYVVSAVMPMSMHVQKDAAQPENAALYAGNDKDTAGKIEKAVMIYYTGVKRYDDLAGLSDAVSQVGNWSVSANGIAWTAIAE